MRRNERIRQLLRDIVNEHPRITSGQCPTCGHFGTDCHGSRAAALLDDIDAAPTTYDAKTKRIQTQTLRRKRY